MDWLAAAYVWIKAFHIISIVAWMAGLLYLPRLFVYHASVGVGSEQSETFKLMERRLLRAIMNPAMIASYLFGGLLLFTPGIVDWTAGWIYLKLVLVAVLTVAHHLFALWYKAFARDQNVHSARFFRWWNEVPTLLMIGIIIMVAAKPF